ncbi:hypothetical protein OEA41_010365 [Lepraria neglecta]|uniref:Uncharacterized protein n=1 Tax=Lepraria neglecta TaxID=209136 RepID=A0AAD9YWF7_9LECA|nr:hypothetical protein OEA41_010365 [Lepraria neglecta]
MAGPPPGMPLRLAPRVPPNPTRKPNAPGQSDDVVANNEDPVQFQQSTSDPQENGIAIGNLNAGQAATVNGQVARPPATNAFSLAGTILTPGAPPVTVAGSPISLGPNALIAGPRSVAYALPPLSLVAGQVTTLNGQIVHTLSNGISIASTTLTPGASSITVHGTSISLGPSHLIIGTNSIPITLPARQPWSPDK